jgi:hypothetical protein
MPFTHLPWWWKQLFHVKYRHTSTSLQGVTSQRHNSSSCPVSFHIYSIIKQRWRFNPSGQQDMLVTKMTICYKIFV